MPNRIPTHRPAGSASPDQQRRDYDMSSDRTASRRFYQSKAWVKLRTLKVADQPLCEVCLSEGIVTGAAQVHHKLDRRTHPDLALDYDNLESICIRHHNEKRRKQQPGIS